MKKFFSPRSIAILGASANLSSISGKPLRFLQEHGYQGEVYPVNPKYEEIAGVKCYPSILAIPGSVDAALIAVNYKRVPGMIEECIQKGVKFVTIFSSGFAETGAEGQKLQQQIVQLAREAGMRVLGPNCQGMVNLTEGIVGGFSASLEIKPLLAGPTGFVTQSGALGYSIFNLAQEAGVGFSYIVSSGNESDLHSLDFIEYMLEDEVTRMVVAYLEGIKDGEQFVRLANRALEVGKPLVVLKVGRSEIGQKAAASHTASLTGSDAVYDAFFKQKGIIRVDDIEGIIDIAGLLQRVKKIPQGKGLGIITTSGGAGILVADEAEALELDVPALDAKTKKVIMDIIPAYGSALNPVDVTAQVINEAEDFLKVLQVMVDNPDINALVIVITMITGASGQQMARDIVRMSHLTDKPLVVAWTAGDRLMRDSLEILREGQVACFKSPVRAVRALGALMNYGSFREKSLSRDERETLKPADKQVLTAAKEAAKEILTQSEDTLTEYQSKKLLACYAIPVTKEEVATSQEQAVSIAESIGYPVALKIDSPDVPHKTEAGGLKLHIKGQKEVEVAYQEILDNVKQYSPKARINGVLVQEMVSGGTEVIVGVNNDSDFGPTVMFGLGGIFVEILKDVSLRVAPVSKEEALEMIREIKGFKVLDGARGKPKADIESLAEVLVKVSRLALDLKEEIAEMDINPLLVLPQGQGVKVADALVIKKK